MKTLVEDLLLQADIRLDDDSPWSIRVNDSRFYKRVVSGGSLALGESYMDGWWDCDALDQFFDRLFRARIDQSIIPMSRKVSLVASRIFNMQSKLRAREVIDTHYDLSPALFVSFLDPYNQYTCGYFKDTEDLNTAQEQKLDLICRKLMLTSSDKVLDVGCGWGGFAKFASERYGCHVTGISISDQQLDYATNLCRGLPTTFIKADYRDFSKPGSFSKILVCGMMEHVGYKNYRSLLQMAHTNLTHRHSSVGRTTWGCRAGWTEHRGRPEPIDP